MRRVFTCFPKSLTFFIILFPFTKLKAQNNCVPIAQPVIQNLFLGCGANCTDLTLSVPHLKQTSNYAVVSIPYTPEPYLTATGIELADLYTDDVFSAVQNLPFTFCFYDSSYNQFVVGSNGLITFDISNQTFNPSSPCNNAWQLLPGEPIPFIHATAQCTAGLNSYYPKASIMGVYQDINPSVTTAHADRKIEYRVDGVAPCRRLIVSFNDMSMFNCNADTSTSQIIVHEGTGIIEVFIKTKTVCTTWNPPGLAILGIQNWYRDKATAAPGKNDEVFTATNEGYRFIPIGGPSRFVKSELLFNNLPIALADTSTVVPNELQINFPNVCPATITSQYVIRTEFVNCTDPNNPLTRYDTVNITKTAALTGTTTPTSTTCGGTTGTIQVTANDGTGPWTFTLTGPGGPYAPIVSATNTATFTGLLTGNYTIHIVDNLGCNGDVTAFVDNLLDLASSFTTTGVTCTGLTDGTITVTPTLGAAAGPYTYTLTGPGGPYVQTGVVNAATFTGLAAGTYSVTFTNASGCSGTQATMVVAPGTAPTATLTKVNTSCPGANNGTVTVTLGATAGAGPYTVTLNPGALVQTGVNSPVTFTGLAAGTYTATFTNAAGCAGAGTSSITIFNNTSPTATISGGFTSCQGGNDGTVTVTPAGGVGQGPYDMTLNPGAYTLTGVASVGVFTGIPAGTYSCTFTNAALCTGTTIVTIVSSGPPITAGFSSTNTACPGANDGTVTVTPNAGAAQGPYTYTLNPGGLVTPNIPNSMTFSGLAANTYTVTVTNVLGCSVTVGPIPVLEGAGSTGTSVTTATSCPTRNDGTITVTPGAGTAPFTYTLNPGAVVQVNNPIFIGLASGTYTITYTTASGCGGTVSPDPFVPAGPFLASTPVPVNPACANINDGTITITNPGGIAPYTYTLTGPGGPYTQANNPVFANLAPGTYNYSFTDGNGCTGTGGPVTLTTNSPLALTVTLTQPLCNADANGIITLAASGGVAAYQYALSPFINYQPTGTFNGLVAGTYTFRVKDNVGCTKDTTVTLGEPTLLTASASSPSPASCSGNDGTITVIGAGGTASYLYSIDGINYQAGNTFTAPAVGAYPNVKVKDANGCIASASTSVSLVDGMFLSLGNDTTICVESSITFQPLTNPETSIFKWRPLDPLVTLPSTIADPLIKNAVATPTDTATYILNAQWGACVREDTIVVNVLHKPIPNAGLDTAICNQTYAILRGSATNLSGTVNYAWSPADSVQVPTDAVTIASPDTTTLYTLTVTDNYGCNYSVTDQVLITVQPPVPAYAGNDTIAIKGVPHQLFGSGGVDYLWDPAGPLNFSTAQNPLATLYNDQLFILKVTDVAGCIGYDTVYIQVYEGPNYYVPNAFSPNGDGVNDVFRPIPVGMAKTEYFRVFNRYGELVFETNQWLKGWDGRYKGKIQPMGTYVWVVKGTDKNGRDVEMKGTVLIIQ